MAKVKFEVLRDDDGEVRGYKLGNYYLVKHYIWNNTYEWIINTTGKDYYYALYDEDIKAEDKVLVTGRLATDILTVKNVLTKDEARELCSVTITEEVRCKVDLSAYNQRVKNREEATKLRKKMDDEIKKMDELNKYEMYADRNPALREMLEQLKGLGV